MNLMMRQAIRSVRVQALVAAVLSGLIGWYAALSQDGAIAIAQTSAQLFWGLGLALVISLVISVRFIDHINDMRVLLAAGLIGAVAGIILYLIMIPLITSVIGGENANEVRTTVSATIPVWQYAVIFVAQIAVAFVLSRMSPNETSG